MAKDKDDSSHEASIKKMTRKRGPVPPNEQKMTKEREKGFW